AEEPLSTTTVTQFHEKVTKLSSDAAGNDQPADTAEQHSPGNQQNPELKWQKGQRAQTEGVRGSLAEPGPSKQEQYPQRDEGQQGPAPALQNALGDGGPPDVRQRRSDELHDFDFVAARVRCQANDIGHC